MTVSVFVVAFQRARRPGSFAGPTRHVYEDAGVRSNTVGTLLFSSRVDVSFSNTGGVPLRAPVDARAVGRRPGHRVACTSAAQSETGMAITGAGFVTPTA